jgi:hypothetical protein
VKAEVDADAVDETEEREAKKMKCWCWYDLRLLSQVYLLPLVILWRVYLLPLVILWSSQARLFMLYNLCNSAVTNNVKCSRWPALSATVSRCTDIVCVINFMSW